MWAKFQVFGLQKDLNRRKRPSTTTMATGHHNGTTFAKLVDRIDDYVGADNEEDRSTIA